MAGLTQARSTKMSSNNGKQSAVDFVERVRVNQEKLRSDLKAQYDFIVCGSGSSGSVVACLTEILAFKADVTDLERWSKLLKPLWKDLADWNSSLPMLALEGSIVELIRN